MDQGQNKVMGPMVERFESGEYWQYLEENSKGQHQHAISPSITGHSTLQSIHFGASSAKLGASSADVVVKGGVSNPRSSPSAFPQDSVLGFLSCSIAVSFDIFFR